MAAEISPSAKRYGSGKYEAFEGFVEPHEVSPDRCPTCGHEGNSRAHQSLRFESGFRQRRRRCRECGAAWFTAELSRDALIELGEQLQEAVRYAEKAHAADLDGALAGIRSALKALETPYRARKDRDHAAQTKRGPERARAIAPPEQG